ncbi:MAG: acyltransferase 3 [Ilumatobacteraceae bacterium]|nr:acyltransferase 3 [Ilumatobacteraceae bacterium]
MRLFAALAVYASHIGAWKDAPSFVTRFFVSGYVGVTVFFVLSGFVLSHRYFDELRHVDIRRLWSYVNARVARIYPVYLIVLAFVLLKFRSLGVPLDGAAWHVFGLQAWESNLTSAFGFNGPAWSISVEFFLYACFPLLVLGLGRLGRRLLPIVALVAVVVTYALAAHYFHHDSPVNGEVPSHHWLYRFPVTRLADFTVGVVTAQLCRGRTWRIGGYAASVGAFAIVWLMCWQRIYITSWSWDAAYIVPAAVLISGLALSDGRDPLSWFLGRSTIVKLGEASFVFYLVHYQMVQYLGAGAWSKGLTITTGALEVMFVGITLCLALGLHLLVELPAQKRLRTLARPRPKTDPLTSAA